MCVGGAPDIYNARGDKLGDDDKNALFGDPTSGHPGNPGAPGISDPTKRAEMLHNWLTGGDLPKHTDPAKVYADAQAMAKTNEQITEGGGFYGLFGFGNSIGTLAPGVPSSTPAVPKGR